MEVERSVIRGGKQKGRWSWLPYNNSNAPVPACLIFAEFSGLPLSPQSLHELRTVGFLKYALHLGLFCRFLLFILSIATV